MTPDWIIARKRDGARLTEQEIGSFVNGYTNGEIPDYQMAALAMAIYWRGMSDEETASLTQAMLDSGTRLSWADMDRPIVDKHSTGGIGDKTSIILAPTLAACGMAVPMLSGRGLGATGGTLDKLESIPGFRTDLSLAEMQSVVREVGCVITGTTQEIAPADRELYALRDVTATVASIPLITSSIMSKKLAEGIQFLVLDVKYGSGAFMKQEARAQELAQSLIRVGTLMDVNTSAILSDMNQPLGRLVGNALEVDESLQVLQGEGPRDTRQLTVRLAAELLQVTQLAATYPAAEQQAREAIDSGRAWETFVRMVTAQGGDLDARRRVAPAHDVNAICQGVVRYIDAEALGRVVIELGGGRKRKGAAIDHSVGLEMCARLGDRVVPGQPLVRLFAYDQQVSTATEMVRAAIVIES